MYGNFRQTVAAVATLSKTAMLISRENRISNVHYKAISG